MTTFELPDHLRSSGRTSLIPRLCDEEISSYHPVTSAIHAHYLTDNLASNTKLTNNKRNRARLVGTPYQARPTRNATRSVSKHAGDELPDRFLLLPLSTSPHGSWWKSRVLRLQWCGIQRDNQWQQAVASTFQPFQCRSMHA